MHNPLAQLENFIRTFNMQPLMLMPFQIDQL
jgi:hypothetical protein